MQPNRIFRAIIIALVSFLIGESIDYKFNLETNQGLDWLFHWRGVRQPPAEVVVVAMDEISESQLNTGRDLTQWRRLHAKLVDELQRQGAALVVFDLQFITYQPSHDEGFAKAMKQAGNVLVTECYQKQGYRKIFPAGMSVRRACKKPGLIIRLRKIDNQSSLLPPPAPFCRTRY
jgi:adenylate cyclase